MKAKGEAKKEPLKDDRSSSMSSSEDFDKVMRGPEIPESLRGDRFFRSTLNPWVTVHTDASLSMQNIPQNATNYSNQQPWANNVRFEAEED